MRGRRDLVIQYVEFVAACRILGHEKLLKGSVSIEAYRERENRKIEKARKKGGKDVLTAIPFPPLADMINGAEARFRSGGIPEDIEERVKKWAPLKREELAAEFMTPVKAW